MQWFVNTDSIVRKIWGKPDTILFIFAGSAAEFALNKSVDWLFYTGKLPADPLGRLFSTVTYARRIVFSEINKANAVIDSITNIHRTVENNRGANIPMWAYRDVLYMLIDYSIRSYELLEHKLTLADKEEIFDVFKRVGLRMQILDLPEGYDAWAKDRQVHMLNNLAQSKYTEALFAQYRKHLGPVRYRILLGGQAVLVPQVVRTKLNLYGGNWFRSILYPYKFSARLGLDWYFKALILPKKYIEEVRNLEA